MPEGKHKRDANWSTRSGSGSGVAKDDGDADALFYLRTKYSLLGESEWWWLMDESLAEIHRRLETESLVVVDGFVPPDLTRELRDEIRRAHDAGHLTPGVLAGGKAGDATQDSMRGVRGDHVGWFRGLETADGNGGNPLWRRLPDAMKRADTLVRKLGRLGGDARNVVSRSQAMCTLYPGAGARYVRHVDNPDRNGRLLTALLYLNPEWQEGDGGELRVFRCLRADGADAGLPWHASRVRLGAGIGNLEKQVMANAAFPVDARQLQEAQSLESQAELCGVHRADYVRGAEQCHGRMVAS